MRHLFATTLLTIAAAPAMAGELCTGGPRDNWIAPEAVTALLQEMGYPADDYMLVVEDGCLEAKFVHEGVRVEVYFEPITGEVVRVKQD